MIWRWLTAASSPAKVVFADSPPSTLRAYIDSGEGIDR